MRKNKLTTDQILFLSITTQLLINWALERQQSLVLLTNSEHLIQHALKCSNVTSCSSSTHSLVEPQMLMHEKTNYINMNRLFMVTKIVQSIVNRFLCVNLLRSIYRAGKTMTNTDSCSQNIKKMLTNLLTTFPLQFAFVAFLLNWANNLMGVNFEVYNKAYHLGMGKNTLENNHPSVLQCYDNFLNIAACQEQQTSIDLTQAVPHDQFDNHRSSSLHTMYIVSIPLTILGLTAWMLMTSAILKDLKSHCDEIAPPTQGPRR